MKTPDNRLINEDTRMFFIKTLKETRNVIYKDVLYNELMLIIQDTFRHRHDITLPLHKNKHRLELITKEECETHEELSRRLSLYLGKILGSVFNENLAIKNLSEFYAAIDDLFENLNTVSDLIKIFDFVERQYEFWKKEGYFPYED